MLYTKGFSPLWISLCFCTNVITCLVMTKCKFQWKIASCSRSYSVSRSTVKSYLSLSHLCLSLVCRNSLHSYSLTESCAVIQREAASRRCGGPSARRCGSPSARGRPRLSVDGCGRVHRRGARRAAVGRGYGRRGRWGGRSASSVTRGRRK